MKKLVCSLSIPFFVLGSYAQEIKRLTNLKSAFGLPYNYIGQVKNNLPEGIGVAVYTCAVCDNLYYVGSFSKGFFSGRGTVLYKYGSFLTGEWKNGMLNGKGTSLWFNGTFYVGDFVNMKREGAGIFVYRDNSFYVSQVKDDKFNGRGIYVNTTAEVMGDAMYKDGKQDGDGYQYELSNNILWEGVWKNGSLVKPKKAQLRSFMKKSTFVGERTNEQVLMGNIDSNDNRLYDTAFCYDLKNKMRYFGRFDKGHLRSGIVIKDDSLRFIGSLNTKDEAEGFGYLCRLKKEYMEGNFVNDVLNDTNALYIDLINHTVYTGSIKNGKKNGKGYFFDGKTLSAGDFVNDQLYKTEFAIDTVGVLRRNNENGGMGDE